MKGERHFKAHTGHKCLAISYLSGLLISVGLYLCCYHNDYFLFVEQLQIFRFDSLYWKEFASLPGGITGYAGNFLTQFYILNRIGGLIVSFLVAMIYILMYLFIRKTGPSVWYYLPLLSIPCVMLFYCFFDINTRTGLLVALFITLLFLLLTCLIRHIFIRRFFTLLLIPCVYWLTGAGVFIYAFLCGVNEWENKKSASSVLFLALYLLLSVSLPYIAQQFIILSDYDAWIGLSFYNINQMSLWNYLAIFSPAVILLSIILLQNVSSDTIKRIVFFLAIITGLFIVIIGYVRKINPNQMELYRWDYHLKHGNWKQIINLATQKTHYEPLFINITNLALAKTGQLSTRLFHFPQRPDAISLWTSNYYPMLVTGEIYYQLDMPQVARSFFFMANTQSPNTQSPYLYKRLAEIELLTDNELMAKKYNSSLAQTFFYKNLLSQMEQQVQERKKNRPSNPGFFAAEFKYNLFIQYNEHPENAFVRDYLMTQCVLENDFPTFFHVLDKEENLLLRNDLPGVYQEFILMYAYIINDNSLVTHYGIRQSVVKMFYDYLETNKKATSDEKREELKKLFGNTYWYYAQFINRIKS